MITIGSWGARSFLILLNAGPGAAASASTRADGVPSDRRYHIDSNVIGIKFSVLSDTKELHTGDPVVCTNEKCTAILSSISAIKEEEGKSSKVSLCGRALC